MFICVSYIHLRFVYFIQSTINLSHNENELSTFERKCDRFAETAKIIIVLDIAIITAVMSFMEGIRYKRPLIQNV